MSESGNLFKDYFDSARVRQLGEEVHKVYADFSLDAFFKEILPGLDSRELKGRVELIAYAYRQHLPDAYEDALQILLQTLGPPLQDDRNVTGAGFHYWPIAHFIELFGLEHFEASVQGMLEITQRFSAEFAIRPFLLRYPDRMLDLLDEWASHPSLHVRRLVSEGTRPRLPWGIRLKPFVADPSPLWPLLERLKNDPELYVRRSVANNLNDQSKDKPEAVLELLEGWMEQPDEGPRWIVKHALRSLVKQGDPRALALLGYGEAQLTLSDWKVPGRVRVGESLKLEFSLRSEGQAEQNLMIDYRVHHLKGNDRHSIKVFKLAKKRLQPGETVVIQKAHSFRPVTTRRYYPGLHKVDIQINGKIMAEAAFDLLEAKG
jgi:3-methyladenine DNA glycosylase AlkC